MTKHATTSPEAGADLLARVASVLNDPDATAETVSDLAAEVQRAAAAASLTATDSRQRALSPELPSDQVALALSASTAAAFNAERLKSAQDLLEAKASGLWENQVKKARLDAYRHAEAKSAECAERIRREYPALQGKLVDLLADVAKVNALVDDANQQRPEGMPPIQRPEGAARGFDDRDNMNLGEGAPYNLRTIRLVQTVVPDFESPERAAWPPRLETWNFGFRGVTLPAYATVKALARD